MSRITGDTKLSEILMLGDEAVEILFEAGLGCIGCPMAMKETLMQGGLMHGLSEEDVECIVGKLNRLGVKE